jgi:hypothetical protein
MTSRVRLLRIVIEGAYAHATNRASGFVDSEKLGRQEVNPRDPHPNSRAVSVQSAVL